MARATAFALGIGVFLSNQGAVAMEPQRLGSAREIRPRSGSEPSRYTPVERFDLADSLKSAMCEKKSLVPQTLWKHGIFDAQIEGRLLSSPHQDAQHLQSAAERKARFIARKGRLSGYGFGVCDGGLRAWALATPAPEPLKMERQKNRIILPLSSLKSRCSAWSIDFVAASHGSPRRLLSSPSGVIDLSGLEQGVMSVTCQPQSPRWMGPVLWYLTPVFGGPKTLPPESEALNHDEISRALTFWINKVRSKNGLKVLEFDADLEYYANILAIDGGLKHDRYKLKNIYEKMKGRHVSPLGEDRVRAPDALTMAWLLWNSPRHRGLLLSPDATAIGVGTRALGTESLAVILTGKNSLRSTALGGQEGPPKVLQ